MTVLISSLPTKIRQDIERRNYKEINITCDVNEHYSGVEVVINGTDHSGRSFCIFKNCPKDEFRMVKKEG